MKEQNLDENLDSPLDVFEANVDLSDEDDEVDEATPTSQSHFTELRRRIEERLDSKRIAHEFDYEEFDDFAEGYQ